ncbi:MAG: choice-of-anchor C family protein [Sandarakinorhabdus sp.]|nr:choice-of-anchor C family protein [Sandarakinorhabdus sp.]
MRIILGVVAAAMLASSAQALVIANGSFERGPADVGAFTTLGAGSTALPGWTIGAGGIDLIGNYWTASDGVRSIDLTASTAGSISQDIATVIGTTYTVRFDLSGNPDTGGLGLLTKSLDVSVNGNNTANYTFDTTGKSNANMGWVGKSYVFVADSTVSTLQFTSLSGDFRGPAIDNISIAVPEASTWAMLIAGFGLVGAAARRRRTVVAA